ncbi:MAG: thiamine pyrophosphate-dependent dehydrogenase E1 component subunit alpha [Chloroflexi bacterium]|nr:thiamine pyrophosphate-dependent dehydrogenase E1 component subunit alpha [Chloroflexota bacterium]
MTLDKNKHADFYKSMLRIRRFEETAIEAFSAGKIPGFIHSYIGEEAIASGVCGALEPGDLITGTHRGHGHCLAKGMRMDRMMAELYGKATGYNKGKGGSMHISDFSCGVLGCNGIVAGGIGLATGAAWGNQLQGNSRVVACFFGDGAMNRGSFHEAVNMASIWSLPVVYVVEANGWGISFSTRNAINLVDLSERAKAYGIPGVSVDGYDVMAVYEAAKAAIERARRGEGPSMVVCNAPRMRGHEEGDPQTYRPKDDIDKAKKNDPIKRYSEFLVAQSILSKDELKAIKQQVEEEVAQAIKFADESPYPNPEEALQDLFVEEK